MVLSEITAIRTGITLRNSFDKDTDGYLPVLQPKDFTNGEVSNPTIFVPADYVSNHSKHLLKNDDLLIVNKGIRFNTYLFKDEMGKSFLASNSFFIVTCDSTKIYPDFLLWYFNQSFVKDYLLSKSSRTTITSLSKLALDQLEIQLPSLEIQKKVIDFKNLLVDQQSILKTLIRKSQEYMDSQIWELINNVKS